MKKAHPSLCVSCSVVSDSWQPNGLYSPGSSVHEILQAWHCSRPLGGSNGASPASLGARVSQRTALHTGPWLAASLTVDVHTGNGMIGAGRWGSTAQKICQSHSRSCSFFLFFFVFKIWGRESSPLDLFGKLGSFSAPGSLFPWIKRE